MKQTMTMNTKNTKTKGKTLFGSNPMIRRVSRIEERSEDHVTFAGISNKCLYFMITLLLGAAAAILLSNTGTMVPLGSLELKGFTLVLSDVSAISAAVLAGAAIFLVIIPILTFFMRRAAAVLGTLYCFSAGYLFAFMALLIAEYRAAVAIALILTVAVCTAMFLLYRSGKITVTNRFRTVVFTLVFANLIGGIALLVCSFIPSMRFIAEFAMANGAFSIICSVAGVVIASVFLLVDFDAITRAVENEVPVENEWYCAFGLAFSVIWLFMKILDLVLKIMMKDND